ncbi:TAXI family TRAP transporter solute-binding subunit [Lachnospiraceae bacterium NSJ-143]|nr:TAXI family TRAP transporter solute-binding subunit [Lachnospiraceae bacterium NSJ-143]
MKKRLLAIAVSALFCFSFAACGSTSSETSETAASADSGKAGKEIKVKIATNQPGQSWMLLGSTLSEYLKGTMTLSVEPGSTYGNILTTNSNETQFGVTAQTSLGSAMKGIRYYESAGPQENVRFVASIYRHYLRGLTTNPDIKTWDDLKGKSVCFGPAGGESFDYNPLILSYYGLNEGDYEVKVMPFADAIDAMKNGQLDAILNCSPTPYAIFDDLAISDSNAHMIQLSKEAAEKLASEWEGFDYVEFDFDDAWSYEKPFYSPYQQITVIANKDTPDEVVYEFLKCMYDRYDDLCTVLPTMAQIGGPEGYADNPANVPVHPGAEKFYKEVGIME